MPRRPALLAEGLMVAIRTDVVILAAGNGTRLSSVSQLPKPLIPVDTQPLLDRIVGALSGTSVSRVSVVLGHVASDIRRHRFSRASRLDIQWIENPKYSQPNGLSLLCAERRVRPPFLVLMADHLFELSTLQRFLAEPCPAGGAVLAVDRKLDRVHDLDDATKVISKGGLLRQIGKHLIEYDAIDTGMFLCSDAIFEAMRCSVSRGKESLSDGVARLSRQGGVRTWDIGPGRWIDVDTPAAHTEAERLARQGYFRLP